MGTASGWAGDEVRVDAALAADEPSRGVAYVAPPQRGRLGGRVKRRSHNLQTSPLDPVNETGPSGLRVIGHEPPGWGNVMNL